MNTPEEKVRREAWLQELGEASVLPAEHEIRVAVEEKVAERGGWAKAHWEALLEEGEVWRGALVDVEPPAELPVRLHRIPQQHPVLRLRRRRVLWGAAAAVLAAVGAIGILVRGSGPEAFVTPEIAQVALLALNDHLDTHEQDVLSDDPAVLARELQAHIPFPVDLPDLGGVIQPVGGRRCTLGSRAVAFTAWTGRGGRVTVIQLRRADFGLPADLAPQVVHADPQTDSQAARSRPLDVFFFGRGDTVWVVVADDAEDLRRVREFVTQS